MAEGENWARITAFNDVRCTNDDVRITALNESRITEFKLQIAPKNSTLSQFYWVFSTQNFYPVEY